mgnify:CR=1 FL=1
MSKSGIILGAIILYIIGVVLICVTLFTIQKKNRNKLEKELTKLETLKNLIISSGILTEMEKVKALINNDKLMETYKKWEKRYHKIEKEDIPRLTDKLLVCSELIENNKFKEASYELAKAEIDIYYVKTDMELLLEDVKEITNSEERNRSAVTKLKSTFRNVVNKYTSNMNDYKGMEERVNLQFENINKLLSAFEISMEQNDYDEVGKIVKALDDLINNIKIVIDETPTVILMGKMIIPKKINELEMVASKMKKDGYNIEYMNLDYNIEETKKKLNDIFDRLKMLNLEDSIFELKTILDYFESLYYDFDKERTAKKEYEMLIDSIGKKLSRLTSVLRSIYEEVDMLKETYALTKEELSTLDSISKELTGEKDSFKLVNDRTLTRSTPYSRLSKDCELISVRISKTEDKLESAIKSLGSLKEDEVRAREQLTEIRGILKDAKDKIKSYKLPVIPKTYFIELNEAKDSISNIVSELEKKPIVISNLNTRVDTGRDLVLKLYTLSNELTKSASMAEMAIVYGNRYRSSNKEIEVGLVKAESLFRNGQYKKSLETTLDVLNIVEPNIHKKLMNAYEG